MSKLWNMIRWGSAEGPEIVINWDEHTLTFLRCSDRTRKRLISWISSNYQAKRMTIIDSEGVSSEDPKPGSFRKKDPESGE